MLVISLHIPRSVMLEPVPDVADVMCTPPSVACAVQGQAAVVVSVVVP
jgi:hypothetical protein